MQRANSQLLDEVSTHMGELDDELCWKLNGTEFEDEAKNLAESLRSLRYRLISTSSEAENG